MSEPAADSAPPPRDGSGGLPLQGLGRRLVAPALLGVAVVVAFLVLADLDELRAALAQLSPGLFAALLGLALVNYGLRWVRWHVYLLQVGARLSIIRSVGVFLVGFVLSVTPGKLGEIGKAWLVRELGGGPARRVVPAVLAERIGDLVGVVALLLFASHLFLGWPLALLGGVTCMVVAVFFIGAPWFTAIPMRMAEKVPFLQRRTEMLVDLEQSWQAVASHRLLLFGFILSILAWQAEALALALVLQRFSVAEPFWIGTFAYCASTLFGAASMLPGGLLASEGGLAWLLQQQGVDLAHAAAATLVIRVVTLWFAVALGALAIPAVTVWMRRAQAGAEPPESKPQVDRER